MRQRRRCRSTAVFPDIPSRCVQSMDPSQEPGPVWRVIFPAGQSTVSRNPLKLEKSPMSNEQQKPQRDQQQQQNTPRPNPQQGGQNKPGQQQQGGQNKPGEQHGGQKPGQGGQQSGGMDR